MADARSTPAPRGKDTPEEVPAPAPAQAKTGRQAAALTNQAEPVTLDQVYAQLQEMGRQLKALYNIYYQDE